MCPLVGLGGGWGAPEQNLKKNNPCIPQNPKTKPQLLAATPAATLEKGPAWRNLVPLEQGNGERRISPPSWEALPH